MKDLVDGLLIESAARQHVATELAKTQQLISKGLSNVNRNLVDIRKFASPELMACLDMPVGDLDQRMRASVPNTQAAARPSPGAGGHQAQ